MASTASVPPFLLAGVNVIHPPHLEGDPTLATEILPGPPSLAAIRQQARKIDPKKPSVPLSYLPTSDPGTTYAGLSGGMQALVLADSGPRRKRARVDRGSSSLAQRPSNSLSASMSQGEENGILEQTMPLSDVANMDVDSASAPLTDGGSVESRSPSSEIAYYTPSSTTIRSRESNAPLQEAARGADKEKAAVRVKEEPTAVQLQDAQPPAALSNEDHCSSCSSIGALVYCDGCPRAFHLWCLDPPMDASELPEGEHRWFCPACKPPQRPAQRIPSSIVAPLIQQVQTALPVEFKLPEDIRAFFRDVATGPTGSYVDSSRAKPPRVGRHGLGEERDPYRLKDGKGASVLCYHCGMSALPESPAAGVPLSQLRGSKATQPSTDGWRTMVSCDFCPLHWHLDCLDPPLSCLPPLSKKWRCPNHASNVTPRYRIPKANNSWLDITTCGQPNNGVIEVVNVENPQQPDRITVDEMTINGRRYRVPERVILLDFWSRIKQKPAEEILVTQEKPSAGSSSPLTSLSSLHESDDSSTSQTQPPSRGDIRAVAETLCSLRMPRQRVSGRYYSDTRTLCDRSVQTVESAFTTREEHASTSLLNGVQTNSSASTTVLANSHRSTTSKRPARKAKAIASTSRPQPKNASTSSRVTRSSSTRTPVMTPAPTPQQPLVNGTVPYGQSLPSAPTSSYTIAAVPTQVAAAQSHTKEPRSIERTTSGTSHASANGSKKPESSHTNPSGSPSKNSLLTIRIPARKALKPGSPVASAGKSQASRLSSSTSAGETSGDNPLRRSLRRQQSTGSSMDMSPTPSSISSLEMPTSKRKDAEKRSSK